MHCPCDQWVEDRQVQLPLSHVWEGKLVQQGDGTTLMADEEQALQALLDHVMALRNKNLHPGVLLVELITADTMRGFSRAFLHGLRLLTRHLGIALVVDEVMTAVRCRKMFSYLYYGEQCKPDFVTVGKGMLFGAVVAVNARPELMRDLRHLGGEVTSAMDEAVLQRAVTQPAVGEAERHP